MVPRYSARAPIGLPGPPAMKRGRYGWRSIISGGGVQSGHSALRVIFDEPLPLETLAADADAVAQRAAAALDQIEMTLGRDHDDGARRLVGAVEHRRLLELRFKLDVVIGEQPRLVAYIGLPHLRVALRGGEHQSD